MVVNDVVGVTGRRGAAADELYSSLPTTAERIGQLLRV